MYANRRLFTDWYGTNATAFQQHVGDYHDTFQRPIWVTEWACQDYVNPSNVCSLDDVVSFMNATQTYLDGVDFVERYAWFGAQENLTLVNNVGVFIVFIYIATR